MWLYGSGFPKSMNIGNKLKQWQGWGTALKPSYEPIIVARKPFKGSCVDNVIKYGVGGINIDECRVSLEEKYKPPIRSLQSQQKENNRVGKTQCDFGKINNNAGANFSGRFPANLILTYNQITFDEVCGGFPIKGQNGSISKRYKMNNQVYGEYGYCNTWKAYNDSGSAARYFYCAKASKKDRDEGLEEFEMKINCDRNKECYSADVPFNRSALPKRNTHPTVKPTELMQYLIRLVTPNGGIILDPFNGSGSTGKAAMYENKERNKNYKYIGIELEKEYLEISKARIEYVINKGEK